jgi:hypothetical protein
VGGACGTHEKGEKRYKALVGKLEGKKPLGKPRRRWEDGNRGGGVARIQLVQNKGRWRTVVNTAMNLPFSSKTP